MHGMKDNRKLTTHGIFAVMELKSFTFNPFSENTYILYDYSGECVIVDPGCYDASEEQELTEFIEKNQLLPVRLINTHCHIDHVFGNQFVSEKWGLKLEAHEKAVETLRMAGPTANLYALQYTPSPLIESFIETPSTIEFGNTKLRVVFTPGHSRGHICLLHDESRTAIVGDVLFFDSIGRTDLPGGDHQTLIDSIKNELLVLEDDWTVWCGHGPHTSIGRERRYNPFLRS